MTLQIATVLAILGVAIALFMTERIRVDIVALLVLVSLALTGLVTPAEALSGFSNLAVVTVWAVLILSGGLARTGVAGLVGRQVLRLAGRSEARLIAIIMLTAALLSGFMNNVGAAALMLPAVVDIARRTGRPPSRLLMPLAFATLLGGLSTLIGTPPNILISESLSQYGLRPFGMFDYAPTGVVVTLVGIGFMVVVGRHLLPSRDIGKEFTASDQIEPGKLFELRERLFVMRLPADSALADKTLAESRLGAALGLNVIGIMRADHTHLAPDPGTVLRGNDRLLVEGRPEFLRELRGRSNLQLEDDSLTVERLVSANIGITEAEVPPGSALVGQTLEESNFRQRFGLIVLALRRGESTFRTDLETIDLREGDVLLVQGPRTQADRFRGDPDLTVSDRDVADVYHLEERLMLVRVPQNSALAGKTLNESRMGSAYGLGVLGIVRGETTHLMPRPEEQLQAQDLLVIKGEPEDLRRLEAFQDLEIDQQMEPDVSELESAQVGLVEVVLSPRTTLAGRSLRELHFREKYGLSVLAIWRQGQVHRANLSDMPLRFGDALLLHGPRHRLRVLGSEPDFLVLTEAAQEPPRVNKAPLALLIMAVVLGPVILGWIPIAIAAVMGVALMILTGCLTMDEAYRSIEWKAVFLIAGMLPLGIAMEQTGAASFLAEQMVRLVGGFGPLAVTAGLFILAALASQAMPNPAVAVLLAPVALNTATDLGISPYPLMMAIAISASAAFLSPVGHPSNVLIMGPGGYRFSDFTKVGMPMTVMVLVVVLLILPFVWPF